MEQSRQKAFEMKEELILEQEKLQEKMAAFLDHLTNNIEGPDATPEEIVAELRIAVKGVDADGKPATLDRMTCSREAFGILIVVDCLKKEHLPIIQAGNWADFAVNYTKYLMTV